MSAETKRRARKFGVTRRGLRKAVAELDENLNEGDDAFRCALALLASAYLGASVDRVAEFTGLPRADVMLWADCWRRNGVWRGPRVAAKDWLDEETGGIAFWLHVNVGLGFMERAA